ncbi:NADH-quinone oxidoreductase subunit NuoF [Myxococcota bacterium]|nr:NADH-quinone oxidoreductase subunit NuoF [Myxococcota bacterium]MBU1379558.1 NADH-quinone oxidoreductase subunit NuoF [Myxococcota bacterium]MBU1495276.1 NADH-quinone oxidoreductase subunit NuoF [Myxococcota bacterium]
MNETINNPRLIVGLGSCGIAAGAENIYKFLEEKIKLNPQLNIKLGITGCNGMCHREPLVEYHDNEGKSFLYGDLTEKKISIIWDNHFSSGKVMEKLLMKGTDPSTSEGKFLSKQRRIVLRNCGEMDPESIDEYIARGGYEALAKAIREGSDWIINEITVSGLRGRGGAGFPTGLKWSLAKKEISGKKYVVCNADEGDPGAFMDRSVLEGDPHSVIEGMAVCAIAIGAEYGYIYCRAEYPLAVSRLEKAIFEATQKNILGDNVLGTGKRLHIKVKEGAGAFVCGEETALMASIEGKRGMPVPRPPFPAQKGLWSYPTNLNNVETYANIPWIIINGGAAFASVGTEKSKGSKVFALAGKIKRGGLVEVPMGITIKEILEDIAGGSSTMRALKAVQMGGPSGGCIPANMFDTRVDYDEVNRTGAIMGSGGMVVMDETTCMVDVAKFFLNFTKNESCGKCTFCRIGTTRMLEILNRICEGNGKPSDIDLLEDLSYKVKNTSLCGLGQSAPNPVLTTIKYFRQEYEAHINEHRCPAGVCKALTTFEINAEKCTGCNACLINCPVKAIEGERGKAGSYTIVQDICIKCGVCRDVCRFSAVETK